MTQGFKALVDYQAIRRCSYFKWEVRTYRLEHIMLSQILNNPWRKGS